MKVEILHVESQEVFVSGLLLAHKSSKMPNTDGCRVPSVRGWCSAIPDGATTSHRQQSPSADL